MRSSLSPRNLRTGGKLPRSQATPTTGRSAIWQKYRITRLWMLVAPWGRDSRNLFCTYLFYNPRHKQIFLPNSTQSTSDLNVYACQENRAKPHPPPLLAWGCSAVRLEEGGWLPAPCCCWRTRLFKQFTLVVRDVSTQKRGRNNAVMHDECEKIWVNAVHTVVISK